jgi:hypothetical protein
MPTHTVEKNLWKIYSYLLHPLFMPVYLFAFLIYVCPSLFLSNTTAQKDNLLVNIVVNLVLFPAFTLFLLKQLKFVNSIFLETNKERIIPVFAYTIYSFWVWAFVLLKNPANYPNPAIKLGLVIFLTSSITLVCNSFYKISLHLIGAGMALGLAIVAVVKTNVNPLWILFAVLLNIGILLCRKHDSNHNNFELYTGFMCGFLVMLIGQFLL